MAVKDEVLKLLEENRDVFLSGEKIAEDLKVSRNAVWKAIKDLQKKGYLIEAVNNKGYALSKESDILSVQGIEKYLEDVNRGFQVEVYKEVESTNTLVYKAAGIGAGEGYLVVSESQTKGKGRKGKSFFSPGDSGVYFSLLLRPENYTKEEAPMLTTMAAVAMCDAIDRIAENQVKIKWVNDLFSEGKKISGILTEASVGLEDDSMTFVVVGIGTNVYFPKEGFPEEVKDVAGALFTERKEDVKNRLVAYFVNAFMQYYRRKDREGYTAKYREKSLVLGQEIDVLKGTERIGARAIDIDENCGLIVRYPDGTKEVLNSGEISIRVKEGR